MLNYTRILMMVTMAALMVTTACTSSDEAVEQPPVEEPVAPVAEEVPEMAAEFDGSAVYFGYDEFNLTDAARSGLEAKGSYLKANPSAKIQIEGHCDERGSNQYNLSLGEKRAEAAKRFLVEFGVSGDQITTISYGEEKPAVPESNEDAWSKNRRAEFINLQ